ncbi:MAG: DnaJ domain-containing protein [Defluviitaleaceae bacterium]|nr:DnaJ domain-containing protein [Defluviitaleaceae bacterium]
MKRDSKDVSELKHKIRKLKQFEITVRARHNIASGIPLAWDKFFKKLYPLEKLALLGKEEYTEIVNAFFARVYYEIYTYSGIIAATVYDPALLSKLGLSPVADEAAVKKRFRELAKEHHPDAGGNADKFIELMKAYKELK